MGRADVRFGHALGGEGRSDPVPKVTGIGLVVDVLELAAAAFGKMAAWRRLAVRARHDCAGFVDPIPGRHHRQVAAAFRHAVAPRGEADHCDLATDGRACPPDELGLPGASRPFVGGVA